MLGAVITFLITALVIYFVFVAPMKKMLGIASRRKQPVQADPTEVDLLVQIRDLLRRFADLLRGRSDDGAEVTWHQGRREHTVAARHVLANVAPWVLANSSMPTRTNAARRSRPAAC